jgi:hypothetical protein
MNAKDYKKLASAKRAEAETFDVTLPSGAVWKLTEPPIQQFVLSGKLPAALAAKMVKAAKESGGDKEQAKQAMFEELTTEDIMSNLAFGRDLLLVCAVHPRIVLNADPDSETEIAPEDILPEDFMFLVNWMLRGGDSGEGLDTFPAERS